MENFACPHCRKKTISIPKKLLVSPLITIYCPNCNAQLRTSWVPSLLALAPLYVGLVLSRLGFEIAQRMDWLLYLCGVVAAFFLYLFFVPLVTNVEPLKSAPESKTPG
ncbi:MAG: hypothetical protein ING75_13030 [Rhodocyclaceae bacterium]|nr:hypothetical protein [Rhodocyclaceae bacterium]